MRGLKSHKEVQNRRTTIALSKKTRDRLKLVKGDRTYETIISAFLSTHEELELKKRKRAESLQKFFESNPEEAKIIKDEIGLAGEEELTLWIDVHEPPEIKRVLKLLYPKAKCKALDIGDYRDDRYGFVIERKTIDDFINSMFSEDPSRMYNRLDEQVLNLHDNFKKPYIIIVGQLSQRYRNPETGEQIRSEIILGKIASISERTKVRVLFVENDAEFINMLRFLYEKRKDGRPYEPKTAGRKREFSIPEIRARQLAHIPGIGMKLAVEVINRYPSIRAIADASVEDLMRVPKIGRKKAELILKVLTEETPAVKFDGGIDE